MAFLTCILSTDYLWYTYNTFFIEFMNYINCKKDNLGAMVNNGSKKKVDYFSNSFIPQQSPKLRKQAHINVD